MEVGIMIEDLDIREFLEYLDFLLKKGLQYRNKQPQLALLDFAQSEWGQGWRTPYSV